MANTSILAAFERMWQHVVVALNNKSDKSEMKALQTLVGDTSVSEQVESAIAGLDGYIYAEEFNSEATMVPLNADTLGGHPVEDFITKQILPLGVEYGGTGATTADVVRQNLGITPENIGAVSMELLWENASPTSAFVEQTIQFDAIGCNGCLIEFRASTTVDNYKSVYARFGKPPMLDFSYDYDYVRRTTNFTESGITFNGTFYDVTKSVDHCCIPTRIYGIKGVSA